MTLRVSLITDGDPDQISGGYLYQRRIATLAPRHGAEIRFVSLPPRRYPFGLFDARRSIEEALEADVVVVDSLASNTLGPWLARGLRRPLIGSVHQRLGGTEGSPVGRRVRAMADRLAWRRCDHLIVPSCQLARDLRSAGIARPQLYVVTPGRDIPEPKPRRPPDRDLRDGRRAAIVCVANWVRRKGVVDVARAVAALPPTVATLHLVGAEQLDAGYHREVLDELDTPALRGRVVRHGAVAPPVVAELLARADIFTLPSRDEPYGMVYTEAMCAGLPIVGWRAGNLPHLIDNGVEGILVPTGNVGALTAAYLRLATDPAQRHEMGAAAAQRAAMLPTWDETTIRFVDICHVVASRTRSPG